MKSPRNAAIHTSVQQYMTSGLEADRRAGGRISLAVGENDRCLADGKDSGWGV
jgi:hypothetical protein